MVISFTCFTGSKVQILTLRTRIRAAEDVSVTPAIATSMLLVYEALSYWGGLKLSATC